MNIFNLKSLILEVVESAKRQAALKAVQSEFYLTSTFYKDIPVYTSDNLIYAHTGIKHYANALTTTADGKSVIFVNSHFKNLPEGSQTALLGHEYAHIALKHLEGHEGLSDYEVECQADEYAQFILKEDVLGTLTSMYQSGEYSELRLVHELSTRIQNLKRKLAVKHRMVHD